jgi:hypothetical protein
MFALVVDVFGVADFSGVCGVTTYEKLRMTGFVLVVVVPVVEAAEAVELDDELDDDPPLDVPDALEELEEPEDLTLDAPEPVRALFDLVVAVVVVVCVAAWPPWDELPPAPPEFPPLPDPLRPPAPPVPLPVPFVPPTWPISASTRHLTVASLALSRLPFSRTSWMMSPRSTSTRSRRIGSSKYAVSGR